MSFQVEPFISTGLQPGVTNRNRNRAASAALSHWAKPLKRLSPPDTPATGLKPGANVKAGLGSSWTRTRIRAWRQRRPSKKAVNGHR